MTALAYVEEDTKVRPQILLIEDNRADARLVDIYLSEGRDEFALTAVQTLSEALLRAESVHYDLILADLGLPDSFGLETFSRLRAAVGTGVPIVILSGNSDESLAIEAVAGGAQDYVPKGSLTPAVLWTTVRHAIERHRMQRKIEEAERLAGIGRLAAGIAHEVNNVLMSVLTWSEVLSRQAEPGSPIDNATAHIRHAAERGKGVMLQVLDYARPAQPRKTAFSLPLWLADMRDELAPLVEPANELRLELPESDVFVSADASQMSQVLANLVRNAAEASAEGAPIVLRLGRFYRNGTTGVRISVIDEGIGVPRSARDKLFEPLFTTKKGGSGLGLAIAYQLVCANGGIIRVEPNFPRGSIFSIDLPTVHAPEAALRIAEEPVPVVESILIVDDEIAAAEGLRILLERDVKDVRVATTGAEALQQIEQFRPDLVILDVGLPDISGLDVFRSLSPTRRPPVIFATGHIQRGEIEPLIGRRVGHMTKPYTIAELWQAYNALG